MKKSGVNYWIILIIIIAGIIIGMKFNHKTNSTKDTAPVSNHQEHKDKLKSDGKHKTEENEIKAKVDKFMYNNFGNAFKTTWYDSISSSKCVINKYGRFFIVTSKGKFYNSKARKYVSGLLSFFNDKTINDIYKVDKVILFDNDSNIIYQTKTVKW